jgi:hypothetical protein
MDQLQMKSPKDIRRDLLGVDTRGHLIFADKYWRKVAIDLEIGDHAIVPHGTVINGESSRILKECQHGLVVEATRPGISQALGDDDWATMIRVSRKQYIGRAAFRHLEDDYDNDTSHYN